MAESTGKSSMWKRMFWLMMVIVVLGFGTSGVRLIDLMLINGGHYSDLAAEQQLSTTSIMAERGNIYDCNKNILATSATVWTVYVVPANIGDDGDSADAVKAKAREIANGLAKILEIDSDTVYEKCVKNTAYERVKKKVEKKQADAVRAFVKETKCESAVGLEESTKRYYPNENLASTVLGYVGDDNQGLYGLELKYDSTLQGTPGQMVSLKNAKGSDMPFNYETMTEAQQGKSLVLTIDEYIQHYAEKYLEEAVEENGATNRACSIVMNVNTGEILGMATKPDFDPNEPFVLGNEKAKEIFKNKNPEATDDEIFRLAQNDQWRNKAISDTYEPGSVFKTVTGSAGLEEGKVTTESTFNCPGYILISGQRYNCHLLSGHGFETLYNIFENSCNPAFIEIGQRLGAELFYKYFDAFGFTSKTGIDLPDEAEGLYYTAENMTSVRLASESFGQTFKITPIQMITAVSAVVNGGYLVQPHIVKQVLDIDGNVVEDIETQRKRQVISSETSTLMRSLLESVVSNGSGKNAYVAGYSVGGKTGTSQKMDITGREYIASFCGFAPADDPEIAVIVMIDEPHGASIYGSAVAAPVAASILSESLPYLGIEPSYTEEEYANINVAVPNVVGKTIEAAKTTLTGENYTCKVVGKGEKVVRQTPAASSATPQGATVILYTDEETEPDMVTVPDLSDMSISEVNSTAADAGLNAALSGIAATTNGAVSSKQSIEPGTSVEAGTVITVYFEYTGSTD